LEEEEEVGMVDEYILQLGALHPVFLVICVVLCVTVLVFGLDESGRGVRGRNVDLTGTYWVFE